MFNNYVFIEYTSKGFNDEVLMLISIVSVILGILIIVTKNPIISVLFLIGLFLTISFYLMFLGFYFIGLSYILVYIGAVSILFLFILMLINVRVSELLNETFNSLILSLIIALSFGISVNKNIPSSISDFGSSLSYNSSLYYKDNYIKNLYEYVSSIYKYKDISFISAESWDFNLTDSSNIVSIGNVLYSNYSIWLLLTSIILLLSMVGCIIITIKR